MRRRVGSASARSYLIPATLEYHVRKPLQQLMAINATLVRFPGCLPARGSNPGEAIVRQRDLGPVTLGAKGDHQPTRVTPLRTFFQPRQHEATFGDELQHDAADRGRAIGTGDAIVAAFLEVDADRRRQPPAQRAFRRELLPDDARRPRDINCARDLGHDGAPKTHDQLVRRYHRVMHHMRQATTKTVESAVGPNTARPAGRASG